MLYKARHKDGSTMEIEAESFVKHGSGTEFHDANGKQIAAFADGEIQWVIPADVAMVKPSEEGQEE